MCDCIRLASRLDIALILSAKIAETVEIHSTISPLLIHHPMSTWSLSIIQIYDAAFVSTYFPCWWGNTKTLKYEMCIHFASCCSCTLVVTLFDILSVSMTLFFLRDSSSALVRNEINSMTFHDAFQFFQLILRRFVHDLRDSCQLSNRELPITAGLIPPHFAIESIRLLVFFFFIFKL